MKTQTQTELCPSEDMENKFYSYPAHKVIGVFNESENVRTTVDDLKQNGFSEADIEVICNTKQIDFSGEHHGFWGRVVRSIQHLGTEGRYLDRYEQELNEGHMLLIVTAKNEKTKEKVKEILQSHDGHRLAYFGNWLIEGLPESQTVKSDSLSYGYRREIESSFDDAVKKIRETLQKEGFGVLTEIDMKEKLKDKLGVDFRNYVILGACNPSLAYSALQEDFDIGLLLPCNVIVYETEKGTAVAAIDAKKMLSVAENTQLLATAETVNEKLRSAIENL